MEPEIKTTEAETDEATADNRFLSPVFLIAVGAFLVFTLKMFGLLAWMGITAADFNEWWALGVAMIGAFAAANNPTKRRKF